jgi:NAD(P)-dependent dehydrogenase (short-subunit alcohol dehydrogenase family)
MTEKIALVTGASRGFGFAAAAALGARGVHVIALARTTGGLEDLDDVITQAGGSATLVPLDVTDDDGLARACRAIFDRWGGVDVLVHAAIFAGPLSPAAHVPLKDWDRMLAVNARATQRLIAMVEPLLKAKGGTAVLPVDDRAGQTFFGGYGATKAAQQALWSSWAAEAVPGGPRVTSFAPNPMPTALRGRFFPGEDRALLAAPADEAARLLAQLDL